jgi:hypothetical protein
MLSSNQLCHVYLSDETPNAEVDSAEAALDALAIGIALSAIADAITMCPARQWPVALYPPSNAFEKRCSTYMRSFLVRDVVGEGEGEGGGG